MRRRSLSVSGTGSTLISGAQSFVDLGGIAVDSGTVYFTGDTGLYRLSPVGATYTLTRLATITAPPGRVAVVPGWVYFIEGGGRTVRRLAR